MEADLYPKNDPERADLIDRTIGEGSPFHETYGYYGRGGGPETVTLPDGGATRLVVIHDANTRGAMGRDSAARARSSARARHPDRRGRRKHRVKVERGVRDPAEIEEGKR